jgi:hypothetical protein
MIPGTGLDRYATVWTWGELEKRRHQRGAVAFNVLYVPAKLVHGTRGEIVGVASYVLTAGDKRVADTIWRSALGGGYVIIPEMVSGKEPVHFSGPISMAR